MPTVLFILDINMALLKFDSMWVMMSEYTFDFSADSSHEDLLCVICHNVMINSVLNNVCGCHYCHKCISKYTDGEDKYCPGDKEYCKEEHIVLDRNVVKNALLNRRISMLNTKCPNESCECYFNLIEMETHLRLCTKQPMECPYVAIGCINNRADKDAIITHLHSDTMNHSELLMELIKQLRNELSGLKEEFGSVKKELRTKENMMDNLKKEIEANERRQNGSMESMRIMVEDLRREMKDGSEKSESEIAAVKRELLNKENIIMTLEEELREIKILIDEERNDREEEEEYLKIEIEEVRIEGEKKMTIMRDDIAKNKLERNKKEEDRNKKEKKRETRFNRWIKWNKLCPNINAHFVWRIDEVSKKKSNVNIFSESFHHNNYKFCLGMYINSVSDNIRLACLTMMDDNDGNVQWPMIRSITINIIDQFTLRTHKSETYRCNFNRPTSDRDQSVGSWSFIKYSSIKDKSSIINNDSIIVSIVISPL